MTKENRGPLPLLGLICLAAILAASNADGGVVNLPYMVNDNIGNQWAIYPGGWFQQQGNNPTYNQGAQIIMNGGNGGVVMPGMPPQMMRGMMRAMNTARMDDKTGELTLEGLNNNGLSLTRRILINKDEGWVRYVDIFKNSQGQDEQINLQYSSNFNFGLQQGQMVADPKKKDQNIAWVGQTNNNRTVVELYCGKGGKLAPTLNWPPGNNVVQATVALTVPAGKAVALAHFHALATNQEAGIQWAAGLNEGKMLADLPRDIRKELVNFSTAQALIGDLEILRGDDLSDTVELRGGDKLNGNLKEKSFPLTTFYGDVDLPVDQVIGILNVGQHRPHQLLVLADGQIFGGKLKKDTIDLELNSGQVTPIPLSQISRVGYRKRANESEDTFGQALANGPYVLLRSGERIAINAPDKPIQVMTRYGPLSLGADVLSSIVFQSDNAAMHVITLNDGSKFSGLATAQSFDVQLNTGDKPQPVTLPASSIIRLQIKPHGDDRDDSAPSLQLSGDDLLVGSLDGQLTLDTSFDAITLNAAEIRGLTHVKGSATDVTVILWDQTAVSGQLRETDLSCKLNCGLAVTVPVALLDVYKQPQPEAPATMQDKIKAIVVQLNADDWRQRDRAEAQLVQLGDGVVGLLKQLRASQPPEAQQRIDAVLKQVDKSAAGKAPDKTPAAGEGNDNN